MKQYNWEQDQIQHMKNYIARFGHGSAKLARQAQSKEKTLAKMVAGGLTERAVDDKVLNFCFPSCGKIPPPVIMVRCFLLLFCFVLTNYFFRRSKMSASATATILLTFTRTWSLVLI